MYFMTTMLGNWLINEMNKRNWSQNELGKRSKLSSGTMSNIITGRTEPTIESLASISKALRLPIESVMREAGYLPKIDEKSSEQIRLLYLYSVLPSKEQDRLIAYLESLIDLLEKEESINND